jgi:hypothetical protein
MVGASTLTEGKTLAPRYVTHEHKEGVRVVNKASMAEREIVLMQFAHFRSDKNSLY